MSNEQILSTVEQVIRDVFDEYSGPVDASLSANHVPQWDSMANVRFMVMVEEACGVRFSAVEIGALKNVGELVDLIASKRLGGR